MATARQALRQRREEVGRTQEEIALALNVGTDMVRKYEAGRATPRIGRRPRYAELLDVSMAEINRLLFGEVGGPLNGTAVPAWLGHLVALEQSAAELATYQPIVVHALLQTPDYAEAIERRGPGFTPDEVIAKRVERRITRQRVLDREPCPLALTVVLDESVLLRTAGGRHVMAGQLDHLATMARRPNVDLHVLTLDNAVFSASFGAFLLLRSSDSPAPYMVVTEDRAGGNYHDRSPDIEEHVRLFGHMIDAALPADATIDLIHAIKKERYH